MLKRVMERMRWSSRSMGRGSNSEFVISASENVRAVIRLTRVCPAELRTLLDYQPDLYAYDNLGR